MMPYSYAGLVALCVTLVVVLFPVWQRGGLAEVQRQSGWIVPVFAVVAAVILAVVWASSVGLGNVVTVGLGLASIAVALMWLFSAERSRWPCSPAPGATTESQLRRHCSRPDPRSDDGGRSWAVKGLEGSAFAVATSTDGRAVAVVSRETEFFRSLDGGNSRPGLG
jgi:hypothetical protein